MIKRVIIKVIVLFSIFFISIIIFNKIKNIGTDNQSAELEQATLPLLFVDYNNQLINCMYGFTSDIDPTLFKDSVTPVNSSNRCISLVLDEYKNNVSEINYEIRTSDNSSLVEEGTLSDLTDDNNLKRANLNIRMNLEKGKEYILMLNLGTQKHNSVKYYTRIIVEDESHINEQLDLALQFNAATFVKTDFEKMEGYLDTVSSGNSTTLAEVDLTAQPEVVAWAGTNPAVETKVIPTIKDVGDDISSFELKYIVSTNSSDYKEYYNISEYYTIKWTENEMYITNFNRHQEAIYDNKNVDTKKNRFVLGIGDKANVKYETSEDSGLTAFVKERQLWLFNYQSSTITSVFNFREDDISDLRANNTENAIDIIRLEDDGRIDFVVYGYMNRGKHEGECGIAVYTYSPKKDSCEELVFIPTTQTYQTLKEEVSKLSYLSKSDIFYFLCNGNLFTVDIESGQVDTIAKELVNDSMVISDDQKLVAYQEKTSDNENKVINIMDLDEGTTLSVQSEEGQCIKTIGFMNHDLAYGVANEYDIVANQDGSFLFPMKKIVIVDSHKTVLKTYEKDNIYIMSAKVNDNVLNMTRANKDGSSYNSIDDDHITNKDEGANDITLSYGYSDTFLNELYMVFPSYLYVTSVPDLKMTKFAITDEFRTVAINDDGTIANKFFVYLNGIMDSSYGNASSAIEYAKNNGGMVVNSKQQYVWEKSKDTYGKTEGIGSIQVQSNEESLGGCIAMIISYEGETVDYKQVINLSQSPDATIEKYIDKDGINLSGCELDDVLYYVNQGSPVITQISDGKYVLIISYNANYIRYIDATSGEEVKVDRSTFDDDVSKAGDIFYSYIN